MARSAVQTLALLLWMTSLLRAEDDVCGSRVDGCSIPLDLDYFYKTLFTPACNRHDICYRCGVDFDIGRKTCDDQFLADMKLACKDARRRRHVRKRYIDTRALTQTFCKKIAYHYYIGVRIAGGPSYREDAASYCKETFIPDCLL